MLTLLALATLTSATEWATWVQKHSKVYAEHEIAHRRAVWNETLAEVLEQNAKANRSWTAGLNEFSDLTWAEFQAAMLMTPQNCSATHKGNWKAPPGMAPIPDAIDWRDKGALNAVKSQGHCGSCWTFSTTGSMEAHHFLKYGMMKNLSEQQLVDCAGAFNNHGCNGGLPSQAFEYLMYAGGHDTEVTYPYTAKTGPTCKFDGAGVAKVAGVNNITAYDEDGLKQAVGTTGPVSIAFQVSKDFRIYESGVYDGQCDTSPSSVNHAVVAVGYGVTNVPLQPYWTVRNSWGDTWGMAGYFKIEQGKNKCGLADCASFPTPA